MSTSADPLRVCPRCGGTETYGLVLPYVGWRYVRWTCRACNWWWFVGARTARVPVGGGWWAEIAVEEDA